MQSGKLSEIGREFLQPAPDCDFIRGGGHRKPYRVKVGLKIVRIMAIAKLLKIFSIGGH